MKIQVIGATGMLGTAVLPAVVAAGHSLVTGLWGDITTCAVLGDVVINCAGLVKQRTEKPDSEFVKVNGFGPQRLAELCDRIGARLIQVSTDCVFADPGPHGESDVPDGRGIYAISKHAGEVTRAPHLTVRTSFIGWGHRGLLHDLLGKKGQVVEASENALWSGHTVPEIARLLVRLASRPDIAGLLHVPGENMSRPELIAWLTAWFDLGIIVAVNKEPGEDRRLVSERWESLGLRQLPPFVQQIEQMQAPAGVAQ